MFFIVLEQYELDNQNWAYTFCENVLYHLKEINVLQNYPLVPREPTFLRNSPLPQPKQA